jgi:hypothetical protein
MRATSSFGTSGSSGSRKGADESRASDRDRVPDASKPATAMPHERRNERRDESLELNMIESSAFGRAKSSQDALSAPNVSWGGLQT